MKSKVQWLLPPESVVQFFTFFYHFVHEDYKNGYPLTKFKQFSKYDFGENFSQRWTSSPYIYGNDKE